MITNKTGQPAQTLGVESLEVTRIAKGLRHFLFLPQREKFVMKLAALFVTYDEPVSQLYEL